MDGWMDIQTDGQIVGWTEWVYATKIINVWMIIM